MYSIMHMLVLQILCFLLRNELALSASETETNNPTFNLDYTTLEKNIAAIFNKVAQSSGTTKRSVPAFEAQVSRSSIHSTSPSPTITLRATSVMILPMLIPRATNSPLFRELPSYAPPSRALFTPPLPPEYANPFADKPTLRGTNLDIHSNSRRPIPPPSLTPIHERIPIKPPDLIENTTQNTERLTLEKKREHDALIKNSFEISDKQKDSNDTTDFIPSLQFTSISRILSGSNGRKQDIPEILLKPISTKSSSNYMVTKSITEKSSTTMLIIKSTDNIYQTSTYSSIITLSNTKKDNKDDDNNNYKNFNKNDERYIVRNNDVINGESLSYPQPQPPPITSKTPNFNSKIQNILTHSDDYPFKSALKIAWSLHAYLTATMFTLVALYSVYKIVRFDDATNLLTQSYFLSIHLLLTMICTLRCFYLFYDAYNFNHSLPKTLSEVLEFLPFSLLAAAFATLILYMSRCSAIPSLYRNKFSSPLILAIAFFMHITLCVSLHVFGHLLGYTDESRILPLICQCIYIIICVILGLSYMYVYRVIRSQLLITNTKSINSHIGNDFTTPTLNTAITTTIATALLFILMGFIQLYDIFGVQERLQRYSWRCWGWEFSVRLIELLMCGLLAWVASLSQFQFREKQIQQHAIHTGFALFPCGSSTSTENMDDSMYPAICSTNQAIQNYTIRTGKQVYDDSFPLNTLTEHLNTSNTFERRSSRKSGTITHFPQEMHSSFGQCRTEMQTLCKSDNLHKINENSTSGSTMLVAEDGFVRFRNLGPEEDDLSDPQGLIESNSEDKQSIECNENFKIKKSAIVTQTQTYNLNTLPHISLDLHPNEHTIYNNT
ncbi:PREDICTED: uncharacterized protein LOC105365862 [Ceratosolen solmsi marchali]|uniref:Uncharacterized protein LOC105365862 n=1 Tax=Ceratosolen solmsi marchali TaxID=326594 RepID=A0AAJ7DZT0_9HYME|nr:PREDICTED: uncharacterized protein LOC105365862 [Ceratosolen solmsi marchali]